MSGADGVSWLWGGESVDTLVGAAESNDRFVFSQKSDTTYVQNFESFDPNMPERHDTIVVNTFNFTAGTNTIQAGKFGSAAFDDTAGAGGVAGIVVTNTNGDKMIISGTATNALTTNSIISYTAVNSDLSQTIVQAKIGYAELANNFVQDTVVNYYRGGAGVDSITVAAIDNENKDIWLNGSRGKWYDSIEVVEDNGTGNSQLAGAAGAETLISAGAAGNDSLWGGNDNAADYLINEDNGATATFFWGASARNAEGVISAAAGNDTIIGSTAGADKVVLYGVATTDITGANISTSGSVTTLTLGGSTLTMENISEVQIGMAENGDQEITTWKKSGSSWSRS
jgi:hypothetical protein